MIDCVKYNILAFQTERDEKKENKMSGKYSHQRCFVLCTKKYPPPNKKNQHFVDVGETVEFASQHALNNQSATEKVVKPVRNIQVPI